MSLDERRLVILFVRSRGVGLTLLLLIAVAAVAALSLATSDAAGLTLLLRLTAPLAAAVIVGVAVRSPFGEAERTASRSLSPLRLAHLALLLACGASGLALASLPPDDGSPGMLLRNGAGFVGLALVGARLFGTATSWLPPLTYGGGVFVAYLIRPDRDALWRWPLQAANDGSALAIALALLAGGLAIVVFTGARDAPDEQG